MALNQIACVTVVHVLLYQQVSPLRSLIHDVDPGMADLSLISRNLPGYNDAVEIGSAEIGIVGWTLSKQLN